MTWPWKRTPEPPKPGSVEEAERIADAVAAWRYAERTLRYAREELAYHEEKVTEARARIEKLEAAEKTARAAVAPGDDR